VQAINESHVDLVRIALSCKSPPGSIAAAAVDGIVPQMKATPGKGTNKAPTVFESGAVPSSRVAATASSPSPYALALLPAPLRLAASRLLASAAPLLSDPFSWVPAQRTVAVHVRNAPFVAVAMAAVGATVTVTIPAPRLVVPMRPTERASPSTALHPAGTVASASAPTTSIAESQERTSGDQSEMDNGKGAMEVIKKQPQEESGNEEGGMKSGGDESSNEGTTQNESATEVEQAALPPVITIDASTPCEELADIEGDARHTAMRVARGILRSTGIFETCPAEADVCPFCYG